MFKSLRPSTHAGAPSLRSGLVPERMVATLPQPKRSAVPVLLQGLRRPPGRPTTAAQSMPRSEDDITNMSLADVLKMHGLPIPEDSGGLSFAAARDVRAAIDLVTKIPLHSAIERMREACIYGDEAEFKALKTLIQHGIVAPNVTDKEGFTFLHLIGANSTDELDREPDTVPITERIKALVDAGANVNALSASNNRTPLDYALFGSNKTAAAALIASGGLQTIKD